MKTLVIGLLAIMMFNVGCPDKKSSRAPTDDRAKRNGGNQGGPGTVVPTAPGTGGPAWGYVTPEQTKIVGGNPATENYYNPNDVSRWFLSSDFAFEDVGATSKMADTGFHLDCPSDRICKVEFGVFQAVLANGQTLQQAMQSNAQVPVTSAIIGLVFFDSFTGNLDDQTGKKISAIPVFVNEAPNSQQSASYIQGRNVHLAFQDDRGAVFLDGTIDGNQFNGKVSFRNVINYAKDTQWRAEGQLGTAQIAVCAMFRCQ